jgi:hypothetical protein
MATNFNINPYYDDFDADKGFLRILFRPGYAVQARELTQMQTILQEQFGRFGNGIYKDGSPVYGCTTSLDSNIDYFILDPQFNNDDITQETVAGLEGNYLTSSNGTRGICLAVEQQTDTTPPIIYVSTLSGVGFEAGNALTIEGESASSVRIDTVDDTPNLTGKATLAHIAEGVIFIDGYFVHVPQQTVILGRENTSEDYPVTAKVGLAIEEIIIDEGDDNTLLDPAEGSYNYTAPGAHRFTIVADWQKRTTFTEEQLVGDDAIDASTEVDNTADTDFIEFMRLENGELIKQVKYPLYSALGDEMARRTYDINGNFIKDPFLIEMDEGTIVDENAIARLSPGIAYVQGYKFETSGTTQLVIPKARTVDYAPSEDIGTQFGNYVIGTDMYGRFDTNTFGTISLLQVDITPDTRTFVLSGTGHAISVGDTVTGGTSGATGTVKFYSDITGGTESVVVIDLTSTGTEFQQGETLAGATISVVATDGHTIAEAAFSLLQIGTARVRRIGFENEISGKLIFRIFLFDIAITSQSFTDVESVVETTYNSIDAEYTVFAKTNIDADEGKDANGNTLLIDSNFNSLIFPLPYSVIRSTRQGGDPAGNADLDYAYQELFANQTVSTGNSTIVAATTGTFYPSAGSVSTTNARQFYAISLTSGTFVATSGTTYEAGDWVDMNDIDLTVGGGSNENQLTVTFVGAFSGTFNIYATLNKNNAQEKAKVLQTKNILITEPNTTQEDYDSLYTSDVYNVIGVYDSGDIATEIDLEDYVDATGNLVYDDDNNIVDPSDGTTILLTNIADKYTFDTGQKDNFYDYGRLKLNLGSSAPVGQLLVTFQYFEHTSPAGAAGCFTVDSYPFDKANPDVGDFTYPDIPIYESSLGEYALADVLDFRPRRQDAVFNSNTKNVGDSVTEIFVTGASDANLTISDDFLNPELPVPTGTVQTDFSYYLNRIDRIVLTPEQSFQVVQGIPALEPDIPAEPENSMTLYFLEVPAYTFLSTDIIPEYIEHKSYTMSELGKIENRVQDLEFFTSLSLLEKEAKDLTIEDANGNLILKTGILVDPFQGHAVGDVANPDYDCAIDFETQELRAPFDSDQIRLDVDSRTNAKQTGELISLGYTNTRLVNQPLATRSINVNPYNVVNFVGRVHLRPSRDNWIDTVQRPTLRVNLQGENDAWRAVIQGANQGIRRNARLRRQNGFGTQWNDWETTWTGRRVVRRQTNTRSWRESTFANFVPGRGRRVLGQRVTRTTTEISRNQIRTGIRTQIVPRTITRNLGNRVVSSSIIPFMRDKNIYFRAFGLKPDTQVYPWFDSRSVLDRCNNVHKVFVTSVNLAKADSTQARAHFNLWERLEVWELDANGNRTTLRGDVMFVGNWVGQRDRQNNQYLYVHAMRRWNGTRYVGWNVRDGFNINTYDGSDNVTGALRLEVEGKVSGSTARVTQQLDGDGNPVVANGIYNTNATGEAVSVYWNNKSGYYLTDLTDPDSVAPATANNYLSTDERGRSFGIFRLRADDKFRTGDRQFRLVDNQASSSVESSSTNADAIYTATGVRQVKQRTVVSTRVPQIVRTVVTQERTVTNVVTRETRGPTRRVGWWDPLAETFLVDPIRFPDGVYISKVDLFFKTKDDSVPVTVQIRPTVNGYPSSDTVLPFAEREIDPELINLPVNPQDNKSILQANTRVEFPGLVYLEPGEHAIVLLTNSLKYETYLSEMGKTILGSNKRVTKQPYNGVLFKSQNGSTWSAYQYEDLMFRLFRADFDTSTSGEVIFSTMREDEEGEDITYDLKRFDMFQSQISMLNESDATDILWYWKGTYKDANGTYQHTADWTPMIENQNEYLYDSLYHGDGTLVSNENDFEIKAVMTSNKSSISPVIDVENAAIIAVENKINNADILSEDIVITDAGSGFDSNNPPSTTNGLLTLTDPSGQGNGFAATATVDAASGEITGITVENGGSGYVETCTLEVDTVQYNSTYGTTATSPTFVVAGETSNTGGNAEARYVTRQVTLADGFNSDEIKAVLNVYRPRNTRIEVYYKVISDTDNDDIYNKNYVRMNLEGGDVFSESEEDIKEYTYKGSNISYQNGDVTFNTFKTFMIKIAIFADDPTDAPRIKDLRVLTGKV